MVGAGTAAVVASAALTTATVVTVVTPTLLEDRHAVHAGMGLAILGGTAGEGTGDGRAAVNGTGSETVSDPGSDEGAVEQYLLLQKMQVERLEAMARPTRSTNRPDRTDRRDDKERRPEPPPPPWLKECTQQGADRARTHSNGQLPLDDLCQLPTAGHLLHADAATGWWRLNVAFTRRFGTGVCVTDSYRSYDAQASVYASKPGLAAYPGTSDHGWGVAADLCGGVESYTSAQHQWLARNGARYGWVNPDWARAGGSRPEPWHWEYVGR